MPPADMHPPEDRLRDYALGDLNSAQARFTEAHLLTCAACRDTVRALRDELVRLTDALPPVEPAATSWQAVRARIRPAGAGSRPWLAAACVALLALGAWSGWQAQMNASLRHDQRVVAGWLARPDVRVLPLSNRRQQLKGRVLLAADHTALFVLPPPPAGQRYHTWVSTKKGWKFGDPVTLAHSSEGGTFEVKVGTTDYFCVSLEPEAHPTRPVPAHIVGFVFL